ncbi:YcnI family protein [Geodermatophilus sp. SYSU D00703]
MSTSLPRPLARLGVVVLALLTALAAAVATAGVASAHVSVSSSDAAPGGFGKLTFRVPNESDTASTVALRISIPEEAAMASLRYEAEPGWTVTMTRSDLETPLENHGEQVTSYVSVVEFRAADGGGIRPGEFAEFALSGGPIPDVEQVSFPTVQTYSDGTEAAWIEPTVDGQPEPERPAPVLALAGGSTGSSGAEEPAGDGAAEPASSDTATDPASSTEAAADEGSSTGTVALVLSVVALLLGIGGVVLGMRAGRRTVSS